MRGVADPPATTNKKPVLGVCRTVQCELATVTEGPAVTDGPADTTTIPQHKQDGGGSVVGVGKSDGVIPQKPIDIQSVVRDNLASVTLADIQAANRHNLSLAKNEHFGQVIQEGMKESPSMKLVDLQDTKEKLGKLNPYIDPDVALEMLMASFDGSRGQVDKNVLQGRLQSMIRGSKTTPRPQKYGDQPVAQLTVPTISSTTEQIGGDQDPQFDFSDSDDENAVPKDTDMSQLTDEEISECINKEVTRQLKSISKRQDRIPSHIPNVERILFDKAIVKAMHGLQSMGVNAERLSGSTVRVPADVMKAFSSCCQPPPNSMCESNTIPSECNQQIKEDFNVHPAPQQQVYHAEAPAYAQVLHNVLGELEIEWIRGSESTKRLVEVVQIYRNPEVKVMMDFLNAEECAEVLSHCEFQWKATEVEGQVVPIAFLRIPRRGISLFERIITRVSCAFGADTEFVESPVVVRYGTTAEVQQVHDGQLRVKTLQIFLNDVDVGGEVDFPLLAFSVRAVRGTAVLWSNVTASNENPEVDPRVTQHHLPTPNCEKYVLTFFQNISNVEVFAGKEETSSEGPSVSDVESSEVVDDGGDREKECLAAVEYEDGDAAVAVEKECLAAVEYEDGDAAVAVEKECLAAAEYEDGDAVVAVEKECKNSDLN